MLNCQWNCGNDLQVFHQSSRRIILGQTILVHSRKNTPKRSKSYFFKRTLLQNYFSKKTTSTTPLLLFHSDLVLVCWKEIVLCSTLQRHVSLTFFDLQQMLEEGGGDENPKAGVMPETMKLLVESLCFYKIMDRSWLTKTKFLNVEKTELPSTTEN